jgi:NADPH:quinone reductase-like Zn-dependent oxidoreductase
VTTLIGITYECDSFHLDHPCIIDVNVTSTHQGVFMDIQSKVFIVTGGASGLGEGTARMLAAHGGKVVIADMQTEKGEAHRQRIGGCFRQVRR